MLLLIYGYPLPVVERTVGKVIRRLRKEKRMSQEKLAEAIDSHQVYVSEIERGLKLPSLHVLLNISKAFGMTLTELVSRIEKSL